MKHNEERVREHNDYHLINEVQYGMIYPIERAHTEYQKRILYEHKYMYDILRPSEGHEYFKKTIEQRIGGIYYLKNQKLVFSPTDTHAFSSVQMTFDALYFQYTHLKNNFSNILSFPHNMLIKEEEVTLHQEIIQKEHRRLLEEQEFSDNINELIYDFGLLSLDEINQVVDIEEYWD